MSMAQNLRAQLAEGKHPLALGQVRELTAKLISDPGKAGHLVEFLWDDDPGVASRAADVLERISRRGLPARARILPAAKEALLGLLPEAAPKKLRWNLALMLGRLPLTAPEARRAAEVLQSWLNDPSSIVKTAALQGLADIALQDRSLMPMVLDLLRIQGRSGTAAMRARSRILLKKLETQPAIQAKE
jgi:hypothetical protein